MQYRQIKISIALIGLLSLVACANKHVETRLTPYDEVNLALEQQAKLLYSQGDYLGAYKLYSKAYKRNAGLDQHAPMARLLLNQLQISLLLEQIPTSEQLSVQLEHLLTRTELKEYQDRLKLLQANLAIKQQQWSLATNILAELNRSKQLDPAIKSAVLVNIAVISEVENDKTLIHIQQAKPYANTPALKARLARVETQYALKNNNREQAKQSIHTAKQYYRALYFTPGIAECLILEAAIAQQEQQTKLAQQLRKQAKLIWLELNNSRAIKRYGL